MGNSFRTGFPKAKGIEEFFKTAAVPEVTGHHCGGSLTTRMTSGPTQYQKIPIQFLENW